jgi:hypothetical protein
VSGIPGIGVGQGQEPVPPVRDLKRIQIGPRGQRVLFIGAGMLDLDTVKKPGEREQSRGEKEENDDELPGNPA